MSGRSKTLKKVPPSPLTDGSGTFMTSMQDQNSAFMKFLDTKSDDAYTRPWHRLEKGLRLNRLRLFAKHEAEVFHLDEANCTALYNLLVKTLDKKLLNSKTTVIYDQEQQKILEIKGLVFHKNADGSVLFQFNERRVAVTQKKKRTEEESE
jgi:hypothetical protein